MLDFLYANGWGAFTVMLLFQIPFMLFFLFIVFRKGFVNTEPNDIPNSKVTMLRTIWIGTVAVLFVVVNVASIQYMPAISSAHAAKNADNVLDVNVEAVSWSYDISQQEFPTGTTVRFSAKAVDTVHGFAVYHPDGRVVFTMMLVPGVGPSSLVYTFKEPGTYKIRCLEYCGAAHHEMSDELIVTARKS